MVAHGGQGEQSLRFRRAVGKLGEQRMSGAAHLLQRGGVEARGTSGGLLCHLPDLGEFTEAFDLAPVRWVIHAVGPIYQGPQDAATLTSAYTQRAEAGPSGGSSPHSQGSQSVDLQR